MYREEELSVAIGFWNDPGVFFVSTVMWNGRLRGCDYKFSSRSEDDCIRVDIENRGYHIERLEMRDFENESESRIDCFIEMINDEVEAFKGNVKRLSDAIDRDILVQMRKNNQLPWFFF